jgi:hypothetical protein
MPCPVMAATANFTLTPQTIQTKPGQKFDLSLSLDSGSAKLDAVELKLVFDPSKLELTNFVATSVFNAEIRKTIDNKTGSLVWTTADIAKPRKIITGNISLGTLTFTAKESGESAVSFSNAVAGSIDSPALRSGQNSVQVTVLGDQNIFQRILSFFTNLFR